jgi:hypothetical protein
MMNYAALAAEVANDPTAKGYAALLPNCPGRICELLNAYTEHAAKSRMVTARSILSDCGTHGATILDKLEAVAAQNTSVKWALRFLQQEAGIDVGHLATQSMIDQLAAANVLTADEAAALKAMATQPASRAEVLGLGVVTEQDLRAAGVIQ